MYLKDFIDDGSSLIPRNQRNISTPLGLLMVEIETPSTPSANYIRIYAKDDGAGTTTIYTLDSDGNELPIGSGGGGGLGDMTKAVYDADDDGKVTSAVTADNATQLNGQNAAFYATASDLTTHTGSTSNPHSVTAAQVNAVALTGAQEVAGVKTFTSFPVLPATTPTGNQAASAAFVETLLTSGARFVSSVNAATTGALPACTYNNGTGGVGATLTGDAPGALAAQDGVSLTQNQLLLVKDQAAGLQNGIFTVTTVGDGGTSFVLTRIATYDETAEIVGGTFVNVLSGTTLANTQWALITPGTVTPGTTALTFNQLSAPVTYTASNGVKLVASDFQIDLSDTNPSLEISDGGLRVKVDDSSIERTASGLVVKALGITSGMLAGSIPDSKFNQIATASKVSGAALTSLSSIPVGAGQIPTANMGTGTASSSNFLRGDGSWSAVVGTSSDFNVVHWTPKSQYATGAIAWTNMPAAVTEIFGSSVTRIKMDLTHATWFAWLWQVFLVQK